MSQAVWIEVLSSGKQVISRHCIEKKRVTLGRGYANDIIIDDPFVAANHVVVDITEGDKAIVSDQETLNGIFFDDSAEKQNMITIKEDECVRLGQSFIRFRTMNFLVPDEVALFKHSIGRWLFAFLIVLFMALSNLSDWFSQVMPFKATMVVISNLVVILALLGWSFFWSMVSKMYNGSSQFYKHLRIAVVFFLTLFLVTSLGEYLSFYLVSTFYNKYDLVIILGIFALFIHLHLYKEGGDFNRARGFVILTLFIGMTLVGVLFKENFPSIRSDYDYSTPYGPPSSSLVFPSSGQDFWKNVNDLQIKIDKARHEDPPRNAPSRSNLDKE